MVDGVEEDELGESEDGVGELGPGYEGDVVVVGWREEVEVAEE